jgi:hypothetical protein
MYEPKMDLARVVSAIGTSRSSSSSRLRSFDSAFVLSEQPRQAELHDLLSAYGASLAEALVEARRRCEAVVNAVAMSADEAYPGDPPLPRA